MPRTAAAPQFSILHAHPVWRRIFALICALRVCVQSAGPKAQTKLSEPSVKRLSARREEFYREQAEAALKEKDLAAAYP